MTYIKLWVAVFFYVLIAGLFVQLVALPIFLPGSHAGDGLLTGGDWVGYHNIALDLADDIKIHGWSAWQLRPESQAPAGIAAALYTITGIAKPWVMLPLNAAVHATSGVLLLLIISSITGWKKPIIWPVLPFVFFPTALLWNTQLHKDSFFIFGSFLFLYGMLYISTIYDRNITKHLVASFFALLSGTIIIWVVRPYGVEMIFYIGVGLAVFITLYLLISNNNNKVFANIIILWLALFASYPFMGTGVHHQYVPVEYEKFEESSGFDFNEQIMSVKTVNAQNIKADPSTELTIKSVSAEAENLNSELHNANSDLWILSNYLPAFIDENLYKLAVMRDRYILLKPEAGSNIDHHIRFNSAQEVFLYIPRALQVGLFAPFPNEWFEEGSSLATSIMRRTSALEMLFVYAAFPFLLIGWWIWRNNHKFYVAAGFSLAMILSYSLVVANVGTLIRMRYGFLMILVALGIAALFEFLKKRNEHN